MSEKYCYVFGKKIALMKETNNKSIWIDGGTNYCGLFDAEITDRKWLEDYKNKLHSDDDWTNINIETYGRWIATVNDKEKMDLVEAAMKARVVGYLD